MGLFALIKPLSFAASFFKTSQLHEFLSICAQKNIECSKQELLKFLCWSKKVLISIAPFNSILEQIGYSTKWIKVWDLCTILFWVTTIFTSCHFACTRLRGVPAILMAYDITNFIIFFFILIQSCKITIYIFHLGELED